MDGDDDLSGRVEVRREGEWGTICKERFDDEDATVICRSLGFTYVLTLTTFNYFVKKTSQTKGFFHLEIIINVSVGSFRFI